ncbi:MAG: hypothetical protein LIO91_00490 [Bacteroidales bacterium]|nr:hypothetical protein [Bacteroidales bacterium]
MKSISGENRVLAWVIVLAGALLPLVTLSTSFYEDYEAYQAWCTLSAGAMSPMAPLTFLVGRWWQALFGEGLLQLHWLAYVLRLAVAGIGGWWLWRLTGRAVIAALLFAVVCGGGGRDVYYDWNALNELWMVVLLVVTLRYWDRPSGTDAAWMGVLVGLMTMTRLPSIVAGLVPIVMIAAGAKGRGDGWKSLGATTCGFLLVAIVVILLAFNGFSNYAGSWGERDFTSGHTSLGWILWLNCKLFFRLTYLMYIAGLAIIAWAWVTVKVAPNKRVMWVDVAVGAALSCWLAQLLRARFQLIYGLNWALFTGALLVLFTQYRRLGGKAHAVAWITLVFTLLPMVGSNVVIFRMAVVTLLPFWVYALMPVWRTWYTASVTMIAAGLLGVNLWVPFHHYTKLVERSLPEAIVMMDIPYYEGIRTWPEYRDIYHANYLALRRYAEQPGGVMILGHDKFVYQLALRGVNPDEPWPHRFEYEFDENLPGINHEVVTELPHYNHVAIVELRPWRLQWIVEKIRPVLEEHGFREVEDTGYNCLIFSRE